MYSAWKNLFYILFYKNIKAEISVKKPSQPQFFAKIFLIQYFFKKSTTKSWENVENCDNFLTFLQPFSVIDIV